MNTDNPSPTGQPAIEQLETKGNDPQPAVDTRRETELPYHSRTQDREVASETDTGSETSEQGNETLDHNAPADPPSGETRQEHFLSLNADTDGLHANPADLWQGDPAAELKTDDPGREEKSESRGEHFEQLAAGGAATPEPEVTLTGTPGESGPAADATDESGTENDKPNHRSDDGQATVDGQPFDPANASTELPADEGTTAEQPAGTGPEAGAEDPADTAIICDRDPHVAQAVDGEGRQEFASYRQQLIEDGKVRIAHEPGPAYDYQRDWCGDTEFRISPDADLPKAAWADGLNDELALAQDAKYIKADSRSTWFIPDTLPPAMAGLAERKMDERLIKYRDVIDSGDNPIRGLEIIVNRREAAEFIAGRMNALNIPGIVRIRR